MAIVKVKYFTALDPANLSKVEVIQPDIYQNIQNIVGIFRPTVDYTPVLRLTPNELRRNGVVVKLNARTADGKDTAILCNSRNLSTALAELVGKEIPNQVGNSVAFSKITKASISRKRNRG